MLNIGFNSKNDALQGEIRSPEKLNVIWVLPHERRRRSDGCLLFGVKQRYGSFDFKFTHVLTFITETDKTEIPQGKITDRNKTLGTEIGDILLM